MLEHFACNRNPAKRQIRSAREKAFQSRAAELSLLAFRRFRISVYVAFRHQIIRGAQVMSYQKQIFLHTKGHGEMHDLTEQVAAVVNSSGIATGLVNVFNVGSTAAVGTIEFEPGLERDLPAILDQLIPPSRQYGHEQAWHDGNGHSHLQATLLGPSLTVPFANGKLILGTWQQIIHLECDVRGRQRTVVITVVGQ
jgi:secondary thiamine-phosphate synthase enzyme